MVGRDTIARRLDVLRDALADLKRYRARFSANDLQTDRDAQHMVLHAMFLAAQAAIDIALHGTAATEQAQSTTYQQAFALLAESGMLDRDLARRMMGWAGLRNVLAHQYAAVDMARIAATLAGELDDLDAFAAAVAAWW